jgi:serine phosphatase RsbU (regulator of sigma subunit)
MRSPFPGWKRIDLFLLTLAVASLFSFFVFSRRTFLTFVWLFAILALVRLLGIARRRLLWKIRNRMIVAGLFFIVTPVVLVSLFFFLVINIIIYQYNLVLFDNNMDEKVNGMGRILQNVVALADQPQIEKEFAALNDPSSPLIKPRFMHLVFLHRQGETLSPFFVYPAHSRLESLDWPVFIRTFSSGYFQFQGRLFHGQLTQNDRIAALAVNEIDQSFFDSLPAMGDFTVHFVPTARNLNAAPPLDFNRSMRDIEKAGGFGKYRFPFPQLFRYVDFDVPKNGKHVSREGTFWLINDYSKLMSTLRGTSRSRVLQKSIDNLQLRMAELKNPREIEAARSELDELVRERAEMRRKGAFYTETEATTASLVRWLIGLFGLVMIGSFFIGWRIVRVITRAVDQLTRGTQKIRRGDFSYRIRINTKDQMHVLAESFNEMASGIDRLLVEEKEKQRLEEELRIARSIQLKLLPPEEFACDSFAIAAVNIPAEEIAGDYFDYFYSPGQYLSVLVADVSGKGASAAFYMAELKGIMNYLQQKGESPAAVVGECHASLRGSFDRTTFITMNFAMFRMDRRVMVFARSGHTPALQVEAASGRCRELTPRGMAIGLTNFNQTNIEELEVPFCSGDLFFFFSDGLTDMMNEEGEALDLQPVKQLLEENAALEPAEIKKQLLDFTIRYSAGRACGDDLTFLIVKIK